MRFDYNMVHIAEKELATADLLSQKPVDMPKTQDIQYKEYLHSTNVVSVKSIPASNMYSLAQTSLWWPGLRSGIGSVCNA
jgi:hypothetical protein